MFKCFCLHVFLYRAEICVKDCLEDQTKTGCKSFTIDHRRLRCNFYMEHCSKIQVSQWPKQHQTWQRHCKKQPPRQQTVLVPGKFHLKKKSRKIQFLNLFDVSEIWFCCKTILPIKYIVGCPGVTSFFSISYCSNSENFTPHF